MRPTVFSLLLTITSITLVACGSNESLPSRFGVVAVAAAQTPTVLKVGGRYTIGTLLGGGNEYNITVREIDKASGWIQADVVERRGPRGIWWINLQQVVFISE